MDTYNIANSMRVGLEMLMQGARQSGRTTRMLDGLKDGDRIITSDTRNVRILQNQARQRGLNVEVIFWSVKEMHCNIYRLKKSAGRTVFDHVFIENFWKTRIADIERELVAIEQEVDLKTSQEALVAVNPGWSNER